MRIEITNDKADLFLKFYAMVYELEAYSKEVSTFIHTQLYEILGFTNVKCDDNLYNGTFESNVYYGLGLYTVDDISTDLYNIIIVVDISYMYFKPEDNKKLKAAITTLCEELTQDKDYCYSWQANIAMAFVDSYRWYWEKLGVPTSQNPHIHKIANEAAIYFLRNLTMVGDKEELK